LYTVTELAILLWPPDLAVCRQGVGDGGGGSALGGGAALGDGILGERVVDPPVAVGVDRSGEGEKPGGVDDGVGLTGIEVSVNQNHLLALDPNIEPLNAVQVGTDHVAAADDEVVRRHRCSLVGWADATQPGRGLSPHRSGHPLDGSRRLVDHRRC
jgi:hypothetical protein